jgi:CheY-like chemotaxis protein
MSRVYRGSETTLLCIDDNPAILEYERRMLEKSGYIVVTAGSAQLGLRLAKIFTFDAVLLDYHMPEMSGHELAYEIRQVSPGTPVVMISGSEIPEETRQLVDAVVPKAEANRELLPTVTRLCDRLAS